MLTNEQQQQANNNKIKSAANIEIISQFVKQIYTIKMKWKYLFWAFNGKLLAWMYFDDEWTNFINKFGFAMITEFFQLSLYYWCKILWSDKQRRN